MKTFEKNYYHIGYNMNDEVCRDGEEDYCFLSKIIATNDLLFDKNIEKAIKFEFFNQALQFINNLTDPTKENIPGKLIIFKHIEILQHEVSN